MIKLDDFIPNILVKNNDIFKHIHPNVITLVGLICNYYILLNVDNIKTNKIDPYIFGALLIIRCFADCIDGAVARKYKKTSKWGNYFDTFSDMVFFFIVFYFIMITFNLNNWTIIFYLIGLYALHKKFKILETHEIVKKSNGNILHDIASFSANNTVLIFGLFFIAVLNVNNRIRLHV